MGNILVELEKHVILPLGHYSNIFFGLTYDHHYEKLTIATKRCNDKYLVEFVEDLIERKIRISLFQDRYKGVLCRIKIYEVSPENYKLYMEKSKKNKYEIVKVKFLGTYFKVLNSRNF
jgi:U3 small nucleolar ribonucleoprotein component